MSDNQDSFVIVGEESQSLWLTYLSTLTKDLNDLDNTEMENFPPIMGAFVNYLTDYHGLAGVFWWWINSVGLVRFCMAQEEGSFIEELAHSVRMRTSDYGDDLTAEDFMECSMFLKHLNECVLADDMEGSMFPDSEAILSEIVGEGKIGSLDTSMRGAYVFILSIIEMMSLDGDVAMPTTVPASLGIR